MSRRVARWVGVTWLVFLSGAGSGADGEAAPTPTNDDTHPAVSPDGTSVVFQSRRTGLSNLYLISGAPGFARQRTRDAGNNENPAWSPGGDLIAFDSDRSGSWQIYVMRPDGEDVRQVTRLDTDARDPSFTADGRRLLFVADSDGVAQVYSVDTEGGEPEALTSTPGQKSQPVQSHDGLRLAFVSEASGGGEIHVADATGDGERRVTSFAVDSPRRFVNGLSWTPQGELLFASNRREVGRYFFRTSVYTMRPDGSALRRILSGIHPHNNPSMARDGSRIAFDSPAFGGWDVFWVGADGYGRMNLTASSGTEFAPTTTSDGRRVVFQSERSGDREIYSMNRDGTDVRNLSRHPDDDRVPSLSADGSMIVFGSFRDDPWGALYTMNADGGDVRRITPEGFFESIDGFVVNTDVTADGRTVLFEAAPVLVPGGGHWGIWRVDGDGGDPVRLTSGNARSSMPMVAPDDGSFLYYSNEAGNYDVYRMSLDGGEPERLTDSPAADTYADWSSDGRSIYFTSRRDGHSEIYRMAVNGSGVKRLTFGAVDAQHFAPRVSADGRDVWLIGTAGGRMEIYRMGADGTDLVRVTAPWGPTEDDRPLSDACTGFSRVGQPHWSWTANAIAFPGDCGGRVDIYVYDVASDVLRPLDLDLDGMDSPAWSRRGDRIAFNAEDEHGERDLYVHRLETGETRRITTGGVWGGWVGWSPDDQWLNGYGPDEADRWNVFRVRVADGVRVQLNRRNDVDHTNLDESPDGGRYLYSAALRIWHLTDGGAAEAVTPPHLAAFMPHWAPDARHFLFDGNDGSGWNLYVGDATNGEVRELTRRAQRDTNATWAPDGRSAVFICQLETGPTLCIVDIDTRRARPLFRP